MRVCMCLYWVCIRRCLLMENIVFVFKQEEEEEEKNMGEKHYSLNNIE